MNYEIAVFAYVTFLVLALLLTGGSVVGFFIMGESGTLRPLAGAVYILMIFAAAWSWTVVGLIARAQGW